MNGILRTVVANGNLSKQQVSVEFNVTLLEPFYTLVHTTSVIS